MSALKPNLAALSAWCLDAAEAIHAAPAVEYDPAPTGPIDIQPVTNWAVVVVGIGDGSALKAILDGFDVGRSRKCYFDPIEARSYFLTPVFVFEPDLSRLRWALGRVDMAERIARVPTVIVTSPDMASMSAAMMPYREALCLGTFVADIDGERIGEPAVEFLRNLSPLVEAAYMGVYTSIMLARQTVVNELANLGRYVTCPGITDLAGVCLPSPPTEQERRP